MSAPIRQLELPFVGVRTLRAPLDMAHHGGQVPRRPEVTLFVDENGHASYTNLAHPDNRFLGLTGVAVRLAHVPDLVREMDDLKLHHCGTLNAVLHVEDIRGGKYPFDVLRVPERRQGFDQALLQAMQRWEYTAFSVCLDKQALHDLYGDVRYDAYHYALDRLVSAYVRWLEAQGCLGTVVAEARGRKEDTALRKAYAALWGQGTEFLTPERVQAVLTSARLNVRTKLDNVAGLQLADLAAYPLFASMRRRLDAARPLGLYCGRMAEALLAQKVHHEGGIRVGQAWLPEGVLADLEGG